MNNSNKPSSMEGKIKRNQIEGSPSLEKYGVPNGFHFIWHGTSVRTKLVLRTFVVAANPGLKDTNRKLLETHNYKHVPTLINDRWKLCSSSISSKNLVTSL